MVPTRLVHHGDAFAWLDANPARAGMSIVTSLPDVSELRLDLDAWRAWFIATTERLLRWLPERGVAIFYQSDIRYRGVWIDKGYLVLRGAENAQSTLLFHKIVCRHPPGTIALGRPSYSHMIGIAKQPRERGMRRPGPDVLPSAGAMPWSRAMGAEACRVACDVLRAETDTDTVVDPFCGQGTVLAIANVRGLAAIGVEISSKRARAARNLVIEED